MKVRSSNDRAANDERSTDNITSSQGVGYEGLNSQARVVIGSRKRRTSQTDHGQQTVMKMFVC